MCKNASVIEIYSHSLAHDAGSPTSNIDAEGPKVIREKFEFDTNAV
jgi:hypothetical protein